MGNPARSNKLIANSHIQLRGQYALCKIPLGARRAFWNPFLIMTEHVSGLLGESARKDVPNCHLLHAVLKHVRCRCEAGRCYGVVLPSFA